MDALGREVCDFQLATESLFHLFDAPHLGMAQARLSWSFLSALLDQEKIKLPNTEQQCHSMRCLDQVHKYNLGLVHLFLFLFFLQQKQSSYKNKTFVKSLRLLFV